MMTTTLVKDTTRKTEKGKDTGITIMTTIKPRRI